MAASLKVLQSGVDHIRAEADRRRRSLHRRSRLGERARTRIDACARLWRMSRVSSSSAPTESLSAAAATSTPTCSGSSSVGTGSSASSTRSRCDWCRGARSSASSSCRRPTGSWPPSTSGSTEGFLYGDFQFAIDPSSNDFLRRGIFSCYRPVADRPLPVAQRALSADDWRRLLRLAHTDKSRAFDLYTQHYLATTGQLYWSDAHQLAFYAHGYHDDVGSGGSEMITEIYVPRDRLADFMHDVGGCAPADRR